MMATRTLVTGLMNTVGLGADVPMSTANLNDGLVAWKDGQNAGRGPGRDQPPTFCPRSTMPSPMLLKNFPTSSVPIFAPCLAFLRPSTVAWVPSCS
jgi:hypothetical protein